MTSVCVCVCVCLSPHVHEQGCDTVSDSGVICISIRKNIVHVCTCVRLRVCVCTYVRF